MPRLDAEKLRRFLTARRSGDAAGAQQWWDELLTDNFDRIKAMVLLESRGRLSQDEQDEALQRALIKITNNMIRTFRGTTMGEWVESVKTLVKFACIDTQRRAARISAHEKSFDAPWSDGDNDASRLEKDVNAAIEDRRSEDESARDEQDQLEAGQCFLDWAIPQLSPKRRAVIELDRSGASIEDIQGRLGVSRDVVYASRSRALKDLAELRKAYER